MIWAKTEAGRTEMQARAVIKDRSHRTLMLLIDGVKSEAMLLANVAGISTEDFKALQALGLIAPASSSVRVNTSPSSGAREAAAAPAAPEVPLDYATFTGALTQLISNELGLRGFTLTLAVEKAGTIEELQAVAQRTIEQIRERKGDGAALAARRALYGG